SVRVCNVRRGTAATRLLRPGNGAPSLFPVLVDPAMEAVAQHADRLPRPTDLDEMIEVAERPDTAGNVRTLVFSVEDDDADFFGHQPMMVAVEEIRHDECRGQHAALQLVDTGDFVGAEA